MSPVLFAELLACPRCHRKLSSRNEHFECSECTETYPLKSGIPVFVGDPDQNGMPAFQHKKTGFRKALTALRPPHHSVYFNSWNASHGEGEELKKFLRANQNLTVLNIGSLTSDLQNLHPKIINLDISLYPNVDVVADAHALPFSDKSIDVILLKNVLEHIRDPNWVISEIHRVLKQGGILYIKLPFLQPFHEAPDDFQRYSTSGMKELLKNFEEIEFGVSVGPSSMFSWIVREYLAILTSFGKSKLYRLGLVFWGWLTFWLKYGDVFFRGNRLSSRLASAFYGFYRKR